MSYIIIGIIGIIGGLSGYLVLIGTNSSEALIIVSIGFVIYGIIKVARQKNDNKPLYEESGTPQKKNERIENKKSDQEIYLEKKKIYDSGLCPLCGEKIDKEFTKCLECGYDFYEDNLI